MPYLEYLFCEHCGDYARLDIDQRATIDSYRKDGRKNVAIVQPTLVWDYLIYSCGICGSTYKYTYRNVEQKVREYFSSLSEEFKEYFDHVSQEGEELPTQPTQPQERFAERRSLAAERVRGTYTAKS